MANFNYEDLGLKDYKECWDYQETIHQLVVVDKLENKKSSEINRFLLVEHPHVYTLGKSGDEHNLLINGDLLIMVPVNWLVTQLSTWKITRLG
jgi:lipoyl(octanoyl) transferase